MSYEALVVRAKLSPHPNADRLQLMDVGAADVAVGLDIKEGDLMVWFPPDGQLSEKMCEANDLVRRILPEGGRDPKSGLFEENRRVRAMSIRGVKSHGYATRPESLAWTGIDPLVLSQGMSFSALNGHEICNKYVSPATVKMAAGGGSRRKNEFFREWPDTKKLQYVVGDIEDGSVIYFTLKLHGTSHRVGHVPDEWNESWLSRMKRRIVGGDPAYRIIHGTRRVVLDGPDSTGWHGSNRYRYECTDRLAARLPRGMVAYGEVVGYASNGSPISAQASTKVLPKDYRTKYGPSVTFTYGCMPGEARFYLYGLSMVSPDGNEVRLPWPTVKEWAQLLAADCAPEITTPVVYHESRRQDLLDAVRMLSEAPDTLGEDPICPTHPREGVVLHIHPPSGSIYSVKHKSWVFGILEGYLKELPDYIDMEDAS